MITRRETWCDQCGAEIIGRRTDARFCSSACRQADYRQRDRDLVLALSTRDKIPFGTTETHAFMNEMLDYLVTARAARKRNGGGR